MLLAQQSRLAMGSTHAWVCATTRGAVLLVVCACHWCHQIAPAPFVFLPCAVCAGRNSGRQTDGSGQATGTAFSHGGPVGTQSFAQQPAAANGGGDHGLPLQAQGLLPVGSSGLGGDGSGGLNGMDFHMESLPSLGSFPR